MLLVALGFLSHNQLCPPLQQPLAIAGWTEALDKVSHCLSHLPAIRHTVPCPLRVTSPLSWLSPGSLLWFFCSRLGVHPMCSHSVWVLALCLQVALALAHYQFALMDLKSLGPGSRGTDKWGYDTRLSASYSSHTTHGTWRHMETRTT